MKEARGAVQAAGMKSGDLIIALDRTPVLTFGDLQYRYDKVDRNAARVEITVERAGKLVDLAVALPPRWWWTDLRFRQSSVEPRTYFEDRPLTDAEKQKLGLKPDGFASEVRYVADFSRTMKSHELKTGDIIYGVDGVEQDDFANSVNLFITLRRTAGDDVMLDVIRGGQRTKMPLKTYRMSFRK